MNTKIQDLEATVQEQAKTIQSLQSNQKQSNSKEDISKKWNLVKTQEPKKSPSIKAASPEKNPSSLGRSLNKEQITNTSPCFMKKSSINQNVKGQKKKKVSKPQRESKLKRKKMYKVDKPFINHLKTTDMNSIKNVQESIDNIKKQLKRTKTLKHEKKKTSIKNEALTNRLSKELYSDRVRMESIRKLYLKKKSKIDNTLEQLKFEKLFGSKGSQGNLNGKKVSKIWISDDQSVLSKPKIKLIIGDKKEAKNSAMRNSIIYDHDYVKRRKNNSSLSVTNKSKKKRIRIQKLDGKKPSKIMKIASNNDLQPKINIYQKVGLACVCLHKGLEESDEE